MFLFVCNSISTLRPMFCSCVLVDIDVLQVDGIMKYLTYTNYVSDRDKLSVWHFMHPALLDTDHTSKATGVPLRIYNTNIS